ncbi:MerR family transcriptional regulator [Priestia megaterium]|uniref:MerR family transcriptional regulator n=1 Tax=Priestia megaterium TaxID=1404 RepID=UPI000E2F6B1B|nr:MerR family transcriptional regulator [Priestia megaterium]MCM3185798.1 MerR family transcriptional regulator [Priestia megaterium]
MYLIDDVTKMTGLTKRALRYYEEIGLILPPQRTKGNARIYSEEEVKELRKVAEAKEVLGFSLQELQQFMSLKRMIEERSEQQGLSAKEITKIENLLENQIKMIEFKVVKMQAFKTELKEMRESAMEIHEKTKTKTKGEMKEWKDSIQITD